MTEANPRTESLFWSALAISAPEERARYLDQSCGDDPKLRGRIEELLAAYPKVEGFLESPAAGSFLSQPAPQCLALGLVRQDGDAETQGVLPDHDEGNEALNFLTPTDKPGVLGRLEHYDILEVIGRGGMGIVLRAFDEKLHRVVAIKVMAAQLATSGTARKRFRREAQAAAAVSHDHIVTIHAVEEANLPSPLGGEGPGVRGLPYLVMQYVSGLSLQQRLDRDGPLQLTEIVRIGLQTASGLAAAHAQGLIHRDIKPANILLENGIERVKITDFGLARAASDASLTQSGVVAGTPQYMSPEQAEGKQLDQRSDLFSLGSLLYAMCTGRAPFRASGSMAVLKRVCEEAPRPIREINPDIPDWLVAIIDKLHAKDPADRYQTAAEVAELLNQHLAHLQHPSVIPLPVTRPAKPPAPRRRRLVVAAALILCLAVCVVALTAALNHFFPPEGTPVGKDGPDGKAPTSAPAVKPGPSVAGEVARLVDGNVEVLGVAFSADGKRLAAGLKDGSLRVWDATTLAELNRHETGAICCTVALSADGRYVLAGSGNNMVLWDTQSKGSLKTFSGHGKLVHGIALSHDGQHAVSASHDHTVRLWDVKTGSEIHCFRGHGDCVHTTVLSPDGASVFSAGGTPQDWSNHTSPVKDPVVRQWNTKDGKEVRSLTGHWCLVRKLAISQDGHLLLSASYDGTCKIWDAATGSLSGKLFPGERVNAVALAPDGKRAVLGVETTVQLWDVEKRQKLKTFAGHGALIWEVAISPGGDRVASAGADGTLRVWSLTGIGQAKQPVEHGAFVLLGGKGVAELKFDTLADAVLAASAGDTIEIRGNGPFVSDGVAIKHSLVIRAGEGYKPSLTLSQESANKNIPLVSVTAPSLVLEGLELRRIGGADVFEGHQPRLLVTWNDQGELYVANCRLILDGDPLVRMKGTLISANVAAFTLRNCELSGAVGAATGWLFPSGGHCHIENCVSAVGGFGFHHVEGDVKDVSIRVCGNTTVGDCLRLHLWSKPNLPEKVAAAPPIHLEFSRNVTHWDAKDRNKGILFFHQFKLNEPYSAAEAESLLPRLVRLNEQQNVYLSGTHMLHLAVDWKSLKGTRGHDLADWNQLWGMKNTGSVEGAVDFQGGDLIQRALTAPQQLTAENFRLHPNSAGYKAGKDGKNLGADIDLVGPGAAYERWQKTPEYQQWLKDTKQVN